MTIEATTTVDPGATAEDLPRAAFGQAVGIRRARADEFAALGALTLAAYAADYSISDDYRQDLLHPSRAVR